MKQTIFLLHLSHYTMRKDEADFLFSKLRVHIKDNNNSPHGKFHRFLFPFSSKFPYLNFTPYLLHSYPGYETRTRQNSEPRLPVAYADLRDHQRLDLHRDS